MNPKYFMSVFVHIIIYMLLTALSLYISSTKNNNNNK